MDENSEFEELYQKYYSKAVHYVTGKVGTREDAEDLVSEAFTYCFAHYAEYDREKSSLQTWLYVVINSRIKNYYRDRKLMVDITELENVLPDDMPDMEKGVFLDELRGTVAKALKSLPERERRIVVMKYFLNKTSGEIADELGLSPVNARVLLSRALKKMQQSCESLRDYV